MPSDQQPSRWAPRYRVATDEYLGFQLEVWRWNWPFWVQAGGANTHRTIEDAEEYARRCAAYETRRFGRVVKELGAVEPADV